MSGGIKRLGLAALLVLAMGSAGRVEAGLIIAYDNAIVGENQNYVAGSIGMDFDVNTSIQVEQLGAFDSGSLLNLDRNGGVTVGIFDRTTGLLVGPMVTLTSTTLGITQVNGSAFLSITPFTLAAGFQGSIVSFKDPNYNTQGGTNTTSTLNSGGGAISFVGSSRYDTSGTFDFPTQFIDGGPVNRYDAGTFAFSTPEPSALISASFAGLLGLGYSWRRRRAQAA